MTDCINIISQSSKILSANSMVKKSSPLPKLIKSKPNVWLPASSPTTIKTFINSKSYI
jgi:hypothetical protein